jgi:hypothetical protein
LPLFPPSGIYRDWTFSVLTSYRNTLGNPVTPGIFR